MERYLLGMDVGGTKAVVAVGQREGEILAERRVDDWASGDPHADVAHLAQMSRALLDSHGLSLGDVLRLGVSAPGSLDSHTGVVRGTPNIPGWDGFALGRHLHEALGVPVRIENDANAAALAEWRFGAGRGTRHMFYLTMSTGVGCGMILDGCIYRGARFQAGEGGHIQIERGGRHCSCGLRGCLEAYVSGIGVAGQIRDAIAAGEAQSILERAGGDPADVTARDWTEAIRAGDPWAERLRVEFVDRLSQGIASLVMVLDPERVVLGTIIRENPDLFLEDVRTATRARVWESFGDVEIVPGALGPRMPAYAALAAAHQE